MASSPLAQVAALLSSLHARHEALKRRVHGFRLPIRSPWALRLVQVAYVTLPVCLGYLVMQQTNSMARASLGDKGEKLLDMKRARDARRAAATGGGIGGVGGVSGDVGGVSGAGVGAAAAVTGVGVGVGTDR